MIELLETRVMETAFMATQQPDKDSKMREIRYEYSKNLVPILTS